MASVVVAATSPRALFDMQLAQRLLLGGIADQRQPARGEYRAQLLLRCVDDDERHGLRASSRAALRPTRPAPQMM